ncbi:hypothetical protein C9374_010747 [Naegleria lovaniensis]|uniref:BTB domain-containing protein n=1 Tax=Naegleria lovaniensis TaxID=51637 RepID=A0AA88KDV4_NAELO|nr:uncharacterized protein C9374_010747 [Naegleria lovaniensis]KAG2374463.1 hypothetical protein C9374_010747 [Naegleria lovaniensis]
MHSSSTILSSTNWQDQLEELQVLQSIYSEDVQQVCEFSENVSDSSNSGTQTSPEITLQYQLKIKSLVERGMIEHGEQDHVYHLFQTEVLLNVSCSNMYPSHESPQLVLEPLQKEIIIYCPPEMEPEHEEFKEKRRIAHEIQSFEIQELSDLLKNKASQALGQVALFSLIQDIEDYLTKSSSEITNFDAELEAIIENRKKSLKTALPPSPPKFLHITATGESMSMINDSLIATSSTSASGSPKLSQHPTSSNTASGNGSNSGGTLEDKSPINFAYHARKFTHHHHDPLLWLDQLMIPSNFVKEIGENKQLFNRILHKTANHGHNKLYVWGGFYKGAISNDLTLVEMDTSKKLMFTKQKQSKPATPRLFASFNCLPQKSLILIGGLDANNHLQSDIQIANISDLHWREVIPENDKLPPMADHSSACNQNLLYLFGGIGKQGFSNTFYVYDVPVNTLTVLSRGSDISPRAGSAMALLDDHLYVYGGYDHSTIYNDLYQFNVKTTALKKINTSSCSLSVPPLTMASLLTVPLKKDSLCLQGGWDGHKWNSAIFEFNESNLSWSVWNEENFDGIAYGSVSTHLDSYVMLGGVKSSSFHSAQDIMKHLNKSSKIMANNDQQHPVKILRFNKGLKLDEHPMDHLGRSYLKWFNEQDALDADVIFTLPLEEEQGSAMDNSNLIYAHKTMLERSPVLKRMIVVAEMKKYQIVEDNVDDQYVQNYKLHHGDPVTVRITYFPKVTQAHAALRSVLQYLYSGFIEVRHLSGDAFSDIYRLAIHLKIPLLASAFSESNNIPFDVFFSHNSKGYWDQISNEFLKIQEEPTIDDIEVYRETLSSDMSDSESPPSCLAKFIAPDLSHHPPIFKSILAHKGLLKTRSSYLQALFNSNFLEAQHGIVVFDHVSIQSIFIILKYIYSLTLSSLDASNCVEVYLASHQFDILDLQDKARAIIKEQELDEHTALQNLHISESLNDKFLKDYCIFMFAKNYDEILKREPTFFHDMTSEIRSQIYRIHLANKSKSSGK